MALHTAPTPIRAPGVVLRGRRGIATRVLLDMTDALEPCLEGVALTDEVAAGVARITTAAMAGSRHAVINEAHRMGYRALRYRAEFRRIAAEIEGPEDAA